MSLLSTEDLRFLADRRRDGMSLSFSPCTGQVSTPLAVSEPPAWRVNGEGLRALTAPVLYVGQAVIQ